MRAKRFLAKAITVATNVVVYVVVLTILVAIDVTLVPFRILEWAQRTAGES